MIHLIMLLILFAPVSKQEENIVRHHWSKECIKHRLYLQQPVRFYVDTTIDKKANILICVHLESYLYNSAMYLALMNGNWRIFYYDTE
jgi:hypothetical protein